MFKKIIFLICFFFYQQNLICMNKGNDPLNLEQLSKNEQNAYICVCDKEVVAKRLNENFFECKGCGQRYFSSNDNSTTDTLSYVKSDYFNLKKYGIPFAAILGIGFIGWKYRTELKKLFGVN